MAAGLKTAKRSKIFGEEIIVNAQIVTIDGFSAHADRTELLRWLRKFRTKPKKSFWSHGEEDTPQFAAQIEQELNLTTYIPQYKEHWNYPLPANLSPHRTKPTN